MNTAEAVSECLITWRKTPTKGRGVMAVRDIAAGEMIECSPVLLMPQAQIKGTLLDEYVFWWDDERYAVALGMLMVYNHSDTPNAEMDYDYENLTAFMTALAPIAAGEEICWNYNTDLWFEPVA